MTSKNVAVSKYVLAIGVVLPIGVWLSGCQESDDCACSGGAGGSASGAGGTAGGSGSAGTGGAGGTAGIGGTSGKGGGGGTSGAGGTGGSAGVAGTGVGGLGGQAGEAGSGGAGGSGAEAGEGGDGGGGVVVVASSCSAQDVQSALSDAPDGATVRIPAGDCDWGATTVKRKAGVRLKGAGKGTTTLRRTAAVTSEANFMLEFDCSNGQTVELSDVTFLGNDDLQSEPERLEDLDNGVLLENSCSDFKVHDAELSKFSDGALTVRGRDARGVIYKSDFVSNFKCQPDPVSCLGYGVVIYGDSSEPRPELALGTENAVFVEDSYFYDNRHGVASNQNSRYVLRHNTFITTQRTRDFGMIDAHGRGDYPPGSRSWEIYANTLSTDPPTMTADGISIRGGDGVIFGNTISDKIPYVLNLTDESSCSGTYPAPDQVREAYIWDNDWDGPVRVSDACKEFFKPDRDYFLVERPGYAPYTYPHPLR